MSGSYYIRSDNPIDFWVGPSLAWEEEGGIEEFSN